MTDDFLMADARRRYRFDEVVAELALRPSAGVSALALAPPESLVLVTRSPSPQDGNRYVDEYRTSDRRVILVTVHRLAAASAAREALLRFLANCMAPELPTAASRGLTIGDLAYTDLGTPIRLVAFVRHNVFVTVHYADGNEATQDIVRVARDVDRQIRAAATPL